MTTQAETKKVPGLPDRTLDKIAKLSGVEVKRSALGFVSLLLPNGRQLDAVDNTRLMASVIKALIESEGDNL